MRASAILLATTVLVAAAGPLSACPLTVFPDTSSLRRDAAGSRLILYGILENPVRGPEKASTGFVITQVIKSDPILAGKKKLVLDRYIPLDGLGNPPRLLIFVDVHEGRLDPFRGVPGGPALLEYLRGLLAFDEKDEAGILGYCFHYLESAEKSVADDALAEFTRAADKLLAKVAKTLPAPQLRQRLLNEKTPEDCLALYGFLLGHIGADKDADLLRGFVPKLSEKWRAYGLLNGYILLRPKEGWLFLQRITQDHEEEFGLRFAALKTVRYFHDIRPDVVAEKDILAMMDTFLGHADMADFAAMDLRRWKSWSLTPRVLAQFTDKAHPVVRRAIVLYALSCPDPRAAAFIAEIRKTDRGLLELELAEKILGLEKDETQKKR